MAQPGQDSWYRPHRTGKVTIVKLKFIKFDPNFTEYKIIKPLIVASVNF
jgi:hypothetical protein